MMPKGMNLTGDGGVPYQAPADAVGVAFAVRAMAVIKVHDSEAAKAAGLTLRQICDADDYLAGHADTLSAHLFRAFGRNCLPVLQNFVLGVQSEEELAASVESYVQSIACKLQVSL